MNSGHSEVRVASTAASVALIAMGAAACVHAQTPGSAPGYPASYPAQNAYPQQTQYPQQSQYPQQGIYPQPTPYSQQYLVQNSNFGNPSGGRFRDMFAGTIALVLQSSGASVAAGIAQGLSGSIASWFDHRSAARQGQNTYGGYPSAPNTTSGYVPSGYSGAYSSNSGAYAGAVQSTNSSGSTYPGTSAYPSTSAYPGSSTYPNGGSTSSTYPGGSTYPNSASPGSSYPSTISSANSNSATYPTTSSAANSSGAYPMTAVGGANGVDPNAASGASGQSASTLYAGMAFEVHAVVPGGGAGASLDPATHLFNTGDRFLIYYRPSMPGSVEVFNTNPLSQTTRIDTTAVAAGQLVTLGPYEFTDTKGEESLRLVLSPCTAPGLLTATRDLVKVGALGGTSAGPPSAVVGASLPACGAPATRGVKPKTRNIKKVGVDGGTSYALDPVSPQEVTSGQIAPRAVTIALHHR